jgi:hypothetical protein
MILYKKCLLFENNIITFYFKGFGFIEKTFTILLSNKLFT